ncbi:MAG: PqqD family protein [Chloroflexi bacterium]|nr:PqqD family protein [Chloroflexota bacterium]
MSDCNLDAVYAPSDDIVARMIGGELIIVPLAAGIGDMEDEIYTLNPTGQAIWERLDGHRRLKDVVGELAAEFEAGPGEIERDVRGLVAELVKRGMLVEVNTREPA